jgi:hypothetical protein
MIIALAFSVSFEFGIARGCYEIFSGALGPKRKKALFPGFLMDKVLIEAVSTGKTPAVGNPINSHTEKVTFGDFEWDGRPAMNVHVWAEYLFIRSYEFNFRHGHGRHGRSLAARGAPIRVVPRASRVR